MKKIILLAALFATPAVAQVSVDGYVRRDGTYVAPHYRSAPDSNRFNNYSSQGNYNPYSGRVGTVNPYTPPSIGSSRRSGLGTYNYNRQSKPIF